MVAARRNVLIVLALAATAATAHAERRWTLPAIASWTDVTQQEQASIQGLEASLPPGSKVELEAFRAPGDTAAIKVLTAMMPRGPTVKSLEEFEASNRESLGKIGPEASYERSDTKHVLVSDQVNTQGDQAIVSRRILGFAANDKAIAISASCIGEGCAEALRGLAVDESRYVALSTPKEALVETDLAYLIGKIVGVGLIIGIVGWWLAGRRR